MRTILFILISTIFMYSCQRAEKAFNAGELQGDFEVPAVSGQPVASAGNELKIEKKIVKDGNMGFEVDNIHLFRNYLDSIMAIVQGYIANENQSMTGSQLNCDFVVRAPSKDFEKLVSLLEKGSGRLIYKNISLRDVTEEFVDIEARLMAKKEVEKRYILLLGKTTSIKEILEIEEKIGIIRGEIESIEGRLVYLSKQVDYSTLNLNITQELDYKYIPNKSRGFYQRLISALDGGWKGLVSFFIFLVNIWPVMIIGLLIYFYIRHLKNTKKK